MMYATFCKERDGDYGRYKQVLWLARGVGIVKKLRIEESKRYQEDDEYFSREWRMKSATINGVDIGQ